MGLVLSDNFPIGIPRNEFWAAHVAVRKSAEALAFYPHHVAAISAAVVCADARTLVNAASSMSFKLSVGMRALS